MTTEPRQHRPGFGWPVDLARDRQSNCAGCGAAIYWVKIKTKAGDVKPHPLSEALAKRDGEHVYLASHYTDCPKRESFGGTPFRK